MCSTISERTYDYSTTKFRYGFNDKENDNEVYGFGNFQDYGARMYNTRLARFISPDPLIVGQKKYAWLSGYQFASDNPVRFIDIDGKEAGEPGYNAFRSGLSLLNNKEILRMEEESMDKFLGGSKTAEFLMHHFIESPIHDFTYVISTYMSTMYRGFYYKLTGKDIGSVSYSFSMKEGFRKTETNREEFAKSLLSIMGDLTSKNIFLVKDNVFLDLLSKEELKIGFDYSMDELLKEKNITISFGVNENTNQWDNIKKDDKIFKGTSNNQKRVETKEENRN